MTEEELTGKEKYLLCMGYLDAIQYVSIHSGKPLPIKTLTEISVRVEEKFTNHNIVETEKITDKITKFNITQALYDIMDEITEERKTKCAKNAKLNFSN